MNSALKVKTCSDVGHVKLKSSAKFQWFLHYLVGGCSIVYRGGRWRKSVGLSLDTCRGSFQVVVVVVESSAMVASLLASKAAPLDFSSTSGVLGGAAFGAEPPIISA